MPIITILITIGILILFILRFYVLGKYEIRTQQGTYYSNEAPVISNNCVTFVEANTNRNISIHGTYTITTLK